MTKSIEMNANNLTKIDDTTFSFALEIIKKTDEPVQATLSDIINEKTKLENLIVDLQDQLQQRVDATTAEITEIQTKIDFYAQLIDDAKKQGIKEK